MKNLLLSLTALTLVACGQKNLRMIDLEFRGSANSFVETQKRAFRNQAAIENSLVNIDGKIVAFFDPDASGKMTRSPIDNFSFQQDVMAPQTARFSYVMEYQNKLLNFVQRGSEIYLLESLDKGFTWNELGVVLHRSTDPLSPYFQIWNVGVDVDENGVFHMLIESSTASVSAQSVGLTYSTSTWPLNFDTNKSPGFVINHGGNPYIKNVPGKGLVALIGYTDEHDFWETTAATFNGTTWTLHRDKFYIGANSVHVCDPHAIETETGILLTVSVDQDTIFKAEALGETFSSLFDKLQ